MPIEESLGFPIGKICHVSKTLPIGRIGTGFYAVVHFSFGSIFYDNPSIERPFLILPTISDEKSMPRSVWREKNFIMGGYVFDSDVWFAFNSIEYHFVSSIIHHIGNILPVRRISQKRDAAGLIPFLFYSVSNDEFVSVLFAHVHEFFPIWREHHVPVIVVGVDFRSA